ncbi:hypothetical protein Aab01nite_26410 [Paractinoplanes abujensis]|uniref:Uncharacterized protein n=1 Tax=Paractinoplanes abujensis TaxID=882441 RepID=A0A7W7D047_9ACTN|nr:hypothetical protein [Actinoplanes abujensis]MBB4696483.1 hypothetical protein [Actinoplanes abujensis]GID19051.1 hypothetical protein Aab01nite_26410 [Actinoplanes abujensis]
MHKLWYAGAALAGGIFLFTAAPAQADLLPGTDAAAQQADERLAGLLSSGGGINVDNPLGHSSLRDAPVAQDPLLQAKPGRNGTSLRQALPGSGRTEAAESSDGGVPLLGGLGGLPAPEASRTLPATDKPDVSGMPLGGVIILPAAVASAGSTTPPAASSLPSGAAASPAPETPASSAEPQKQKQKKHKEPKQKPTPAATPDDPRLHEEPVDNDDTETEQQPFSAGAQQ